MSENRRIRTRFAPSPTGDPHIGGIQKIVYSYACAKHFGGDYLLRIEDTDQSRLTEGSEEKIYELHNELGIIPDESPIHGNQKYGPYKQSQRLALYKKYAEQLIHSGHAYYAFETAEELDAARKLAQSTGKLYKYTSRYRDMPLAEAQALLADGRKYVVRIKSPRGEEVTVDDWIMGKITVKTSDLDDYVLLKSDGYPTYHLAVVVDDHLMEITHVFRGVEWIATAPIHVLLYKYLGWEAPIFAHIPNILDPKGGKLSKRNGSVGAMEFIKEGYLPAAIINYMILQSWNPKNNVELISLAEFVEIFDAAKFNKSNPMFDRNKLLWFNSQYLSLSDSKKLAADFVNWVTRHHPEHHLVKVIPPSDPKLIAAIELEKTRSQTLLELLNVLEIFYVRPTSYDFSHKQTKNLNPDQIKTILNSIVPLLNGVMEFTHENWENTIRETALKLAIPAGSAFMLARISITGKTATPPLFEFINAIGREEALRRVEDCLATI